MSDEEPAFLSNAVLDFMKDNNLKFRTVTDNDHHLLGIINRFIRTIRDLAPDDPTPEELSD
jgi:hypothetical protein